MSERLPAAEPTTVAQQVRTISRRRVSERIDRLGELGADPDDEATLALLHSLDHRSWQVRAAAVVLLGNRGPAWARIAARASIQDPNALVRSEAADLLAEHGDQRDVTRLITALQDPAWTVRSSAAVSLGYRRGDRSKRALCGALQGERDPVARRDIAFALGSFPGPDVQRCAEEQLVREKAEIVRLGLLWALYRCGERARLAEYLRYLDSTEWLVPENTINGLPYQDVLAEDHALVASALRRLLAGEPAPALRDSAERLLASLCPEEAS
jgi:HEAT repeat protein